MHTYILAQASPTAGCGRLPSLTYLLTYLGLSYSRMREVALDHTYIHTYILIYIHTYRPLLQPDAGGRTRSSGHVSWQAAHPPTCRVLVSTPPAPPSRIPRGAYAHIPMPIRPECQHTSAHGPAHSMPGDGAGARKAAADCRA